MIKLKLVIADLDNDGGKTAPWYYGYSYSPYDYLAHVYYIFPLNHIVAWSRWVWRHIHHAKMDKTAYKVRRIISAAKTKSFRVGVAVGRRQGKSIAFNKGYKEGIKYATTQFTHHIKEELRLKSPEEYEAFYKPIRSDFNDSTR